LIEQTFRQSGAKPKWWALVEETLRLSEKYRFFHWELEFPDAFTKERRGFDLIVMNPPWDVLKPEDDDFFSVYYPRFRRIGSKPEKRKIMSSLLKDRSISIAYEEYCRTIEEKVRFFKKSGQYVKRGSGDTDSWKLFLERTLNLVSENGSIAVVIPSGIVNAEGGKQLREALFENRIRTMFEFENTKGIFTDVHRSYKFVLLVVDKSSPTESFPAAFYLHEIAALDGEAEREKFVETPIELVKISAPESLSIPEIRNEPLLEVFSWLYKNHPLLNDEKKGWTLTLLRELDRTNDSDLFRRDVKGWPLIEGKNFHQFILDFEKTAYTVDQKEGLKRAEKHKEFKGRNQQIHEVVRLAFRDVASSTNVRSAIACVVPPRTFNSNKAPLIIPYADLSQETQLYYRKIAYLAGIFNSFVFDFLIRQRVSMGLNFFYVYQTPVPPKIENETATQIITISAKLSSPDERFKDFASALGVQCGPLSMRERIELTAKLNALVAKHYRLNKEHFNLILQSFEGFEEDKELVNMKEVKWDDTLIRKFNGEVRKRVLPIFDQLTSEETKVKTS
jgi:hypothetical protein